MYSKSKIPPKVIAEVGCNHKGNMQIAKELITTAASFSGVDVVKFQKRNNKELLSREQYSSPHPNPENSYGQTYGEHREFLEFDLDQHRQLKSWCDESEVEYSSSVWDVTSAREIMSINPSMIKIPSACNLNKELLNELADHFNGEIHISMGMTSPAEIEKIVSFFVTKGRGKDLVIYSCTSGYPVKADDVCLLEIVKLKEKYASVVKSIGFSGHHLGIAIDIAAVVMGVSHIERHYTLDRTWKGTDHAASLEPDGIRRLCRDVSAVYKSLSFKNKGVLEIEMDQRKKLKNNSIKWV